MAVPLPRSARFRARPFSGSDMKGPFSESPALWHRLLGRSWGAVSENGRLRHGEGTRGWGARRRRALMWAILLHPDGIRKSLPGKKGTSCDAIKG